MKGLFRQEVVKSKKARLEGTISLAQPPAFGLLAILIFVAMAIGFVFLFSAEYVKKERVPGILRPSSGIIRVGAPKSGIIAELLAHEGTLVSKGQPILRITGEKHGENNFELIQARIERHSDNVRTLKQILAQQTTEHELQMILIRSNFASLRKQLDQLDRQLDLSVRRIEINAEIETNMSALISKGYVSTLDFKRQNDTLLALKMQHNAIQIQKLDTESELKTIENQLSQLPLDQNKNRIELKNQIAEIELQVAESRQEQASEVRSPTAGLVTGLLVKEGEMVATNQKLLSIAPKAALMQAVLFVPSTAIGFLENGQEVRIRYDAFPYEKFGVYKGRISEISANILLPGEIDISGAVLQPSYRVTVDLDEDRVTAYGRTVPLRAGMSLNADVVIDKRSLLHWLFDPVFSVTGSK